MADVLCVSGMHRSGTSLTMGWLERCGLVVDDGKRLAVTEGNPKGHYEDAEMALTQHQAILQAYPGSKGWQVLDEHAAETLRLPPQTGKLIERRNQQFPLWGWKDPRSVHFLGQWKKLIPELKVLLLWRPCAQVVSSLLRRSAIAGPETGEFLDIGAADAERLWLNSNQQMLGFLAQHPDDCLLVSLDEVIQNGKSLIALINKRFSMNLEELAVTDSFDKSLLQRKDIGRFSPINATKIEELTAVLNARSVGLSHAN